MHISHKYKMTAHHTQSIAKPARSGSKKNIASLDGLRAFAALGVVTLHITYLVGYIVVNEYQYSWLASFWVLAILACNSFLSCRAFSYLCRMRRLCYLEKPGLQSAPFIYAGLCASFPGYYFSLALLVVLVQPVYLHPDHWARLFLFLTFFMDSSKATFEQINVPYWTLGVEVQFYLLLPLVALGMRALVQRVARTPRRRFTSAIIACLGVMLYGLVVRYAGLQLALRPQGGLVAVAQFLLFGVRGKFWESFAIGMLVSLCFIYAQHPEYGQRLQSTLKKISPLSGLGALGIITFCSLWNFRDGYHVPQLNFLLPLVQYGPLFLEFCVSLGWGLLIATVLSGYALFRVPFEWRPVRWLGTISYSIYIWHLPLLTIFQRHVVSHLHITTIALSHLIYWSFFALVVVPWCALVYWFIERPFMRMKDRQKKSGTPVETKDENQPISSSNDASPTKEKVVVNSSNS